MIVFKNEGHSYNHLQRRVEGGDIEFIEEECPDPPLPGAGGASCSAQSPGTQAQGTQHIHLSTVNDSLL